MEGYKVLYEFDDGQIGKCTVYQEIETTTITPDQSCAFMHESKIYKPLEQVKAYKTIYVYPNREECYFVPLSGQTVRAYRIGNETDIQTITI